MTITAKRFFTCLLRATLMPFDSDVFDDLINWDIIAA
jgi:hypothetical protein